MEPDVISFSAAISACEKAAQWERALELLEEMPTRGVKPDVISFNATISAWLICPPRLMRQDATIAHSLLAAHERSNAWD